MDSSNSIDPNVFNTFVSASRGCSSADSSIRKEAEKYFQTVRHSDNCLQLCRTMLENAPPQLPYTDRLHVQFHAAHILCNACLDHWDRMDAISRKQLRNYLFDLAIKSGAAEKGSPSFMAPSVMNKL